MVDDWSSYDPTGVDEFYNAVDSGEISAVVFGLDDIPLDTITQEQYLMQGEFDAADFTSGNYILVIGPALEQGESRSALPAPSVGSTITLEEKDYTVMAVVYPLMPVNDGESEIGASDAMELHFILPADTFRTLWPDSTLRKLFVNVDDVHLAETQDFLDDYIATVDPSLPVTSRETMAEQYEAETCSASVTGNEVSMVIALVGVLNFINSMITAIVSRKREFAVMQSVGMTKSN